VADLVLVRHASTEWTGRRYCGRSDPPLDEAGVASAERLVEDLRTRLAPGIRIVSSPRRRAIQTANAFASALATGPIEIDERWAETDFGIAEGLTFDELALVAPDIARRLGAGDVEIDWPDGESAAALLARVDAAWRDAGSRPGGCLVVSHGGPMRVAIARAMGQPANEVAIPDAGGAVQLSLDESSMSWSAREVS
jgi:alpha-ribazole phosphatase